MTTNDELYARLRVVGDKVQDILIEAQDDLSIIGFVILAHDEGQGTADARYKVSDEAFRASMYAVADNLRPTGEKR